MKKEYVYLVTTHVYSVYISRNKTSTTDANMCLSLSKFFQALSFVFCDTLVEAWTTVKFKGEEEKQKRERTEGGRGYHKNKTVICKYLHYLYLLYDKMVQMTL